MKIKIIKNGKVSKWFQLTKKIHRRLIELQPDEVLVMIRDYKNSPDNCTLKLDFHIFTVITREMTLYQNKLRKRDERHCDTRSLDQIDPAEHSAPYQDIEEMLIEKEQRETLLLARQCLTETQKRRLALHIEKGLSFSEIAHAEGVNPKTVEETIKSAYKKIKKYFY